jgi:hypothetical protein
MQGQQLFKSVRGKRIGHSFQVTTNRSIDTAVPPFPVHWDTRLSARSTENSQVQSSHSQPAGMRGRDGDFPIDSHIPATRPGQESESIIGRTELLRWAAYVLGILLFVGGITIMLF